jgi:hypothetical protein
MEREHALEYVPFNVAKESGYKTVDTLATQTHLELGRSKGLPQPKLELRYGVVQWMYHLLSRHLEGVQDCVSAAHLCSSSTSSL